MSCENYTKQDFAAMKKLLSSWHVEILYDLFKEEDIAIEELKMMQFTHINSLLQNYKMGVKIRFEHNFINWRNKLGIPLKNFDNNPSNSFCCHFNKPIYENYPEEVLNTKIVEETTAKKRKINNEELLVTDDRLEMESTQHLRSPHDTKSGKSSNQITVRNEARQTPSTILESPTHQTSHTEDEGEQDNCSLSTLRDVLATSVEEETPNFPSRSTPYKCPASLRQILELSGAKGMSIIHFYEENKYLTNVQRVQLIQIIVDFFDENDYHLSLYMSHNLEWEILKMFPNEKLEYYRTEKRGKIYVKFSNMKRYKRERNNKTKMDTDLTQCRPRRSLNPNHQLEDINVENNPIMDNDDNETDWNFSSEIDIKIKEETPEII